MEIPDIIFALTIIVVSAWIAYQWVIKPEREQRRRKSEQALAQMRRHREVGLPKHGEQRGKSVRATSSATLSSQS